MVEKRQALCVQYLYETKERKNPSTPFLSNLGAPTHAGDGASSPEIQAANVGSRAARDGYIAETDLQGVSCASTTAKDRL